MSDNRRRTYCRIMFMIFCALPTSLVGYKIFHPQTASEWQSQIQAQLGVKTTIDSIDTPGPYVTILRGLEFSDPEVGTLFSTVEARVLFGKDVNTIEIPHPIHGSSALSNHGLATLVEQLNRNLIRAHRADKPWRISFGRDVPIKNFLAEDSEPNIGNEVVLQGLQIDVVPMVEGTYANATFHVKGQEQARPVSFQVSRMADRGKLLEIDTGDYALPCWLLATKVTEMSELGQEAHFVGGAEYSPHIGMPRLFVHGELKGVDLAASYSVTGGTRFADIEIQNCLFENDVIKGNAIIKRLGHSATKIRLDMLVPSRPEFSPGSAIRFAMTKGLVMPTGTRVSDGNSDMHYRP